MDLINKQDGAAVTVKLLQQAFEALLKITAVFCTCHHGCHIQRQKPLAAQRRGDLPGGNFLRQRLRQGAFANARLAQQAGVVFLAAAQNFNHTRKLVVPAQHRVQPPVLRKAGQVAPVFVAGAIAARGAHPGLNGQNRLPAELAAFPRCLCDFHPKGCQPHAGGAGGILQHGAEQMLVFCLGAVGGVRPQHRKFQRLAALAGKVVFVQAAWRSRRML